jgi:hypothetical protein
MLDKVLVIKAEKQHNSRKTDKTLGLRFRIDINLFEENGGCE